jgi:putative tricarboxylic transport membrane protein
MSDALDAGTAPAPAAPPAAPRRGGLVGNLVLASVGLLAVVGGVGYGVTGATGPVGPGFVPALAGALMALFSVVELVRIVRARPPREAAPDGAPAPGDPVAATDDVDQFGRTDRQRSRAIVAIFAIVALGVAVTPFLGLLTAMGLVVLALTLGIERRPVVPSVLTAAGTVAFAYVVFVLVLRVPVPVGPLGL